MKTNILILGGGLAGLTAAIHLSKLGHEVTVIEKNSYPKHKVCGEYISNEVEEYFKWLDLQHVLDRSQPIKDFRLDINETNSASVALPLGGFGISRHLLDDLLYQMAKEQNCQFIHDAVVNINFRNNVFEVDLSSGIKIETLLVLGSFGKRSTIDIQLHREFIQKKSYWLAVKSHYEGDFPNELVGLYPFDGGYCGVSKIENNRINICYIVQTAIFKKFKNTVDFEEHVLAKNSSLHYILNNSVSLFEKPLTISQISFDAKQAVENHIIMIGDAAGLIHPLCGNGMAMAIHSAKIASELVHEALKQKVFDRENLEKAYEKKWDQTFKNRMQVGRMLSKLLLSPQLTKISLLTLARFPRLFKAIIKKTHGTLISKPSL